MVIIIVPDLILIYFCQSKYCRFDIKCIYIYILITDIIRKSRENMQNCMILAHCFGEKLHCSISVIILNNNLLMLFFYFKKYIYISISIKIYIQFLLVYKKCINKENKVSTCLDFI